MKSRSHQPSGGEVKDFIYTLTFDHPWLVFGGIAIVVVALLFWLAWLIAEEKADREEAKRLANRAAFHDRADENDDQR